MTPTHAATLIVLRESLGMLRDAIDGLPDEAADWRPAPGTNSVAVLVTHSITSARFFLGNGSNRPGSIVRYRAEERARSFEASGVAVAGLVKAIDAFIPEAEEMLANGDEASLAAIVDWSAEAPGEPVRSGVECLLRAVAHLREHVGQVQLMRDLWLARA